MEIKKKILNLVFSKNSEKVFKLFFWKLKKNFGWLKVNKIFYLETL